MRIWCVLGAWIRAARAWVSDWHEVLAGPLGIGLFALSEWALRWVDPTAGVYDWGVFQSAVWAVGVLMLLKGVAWLSLRLDLPEAYRLLDRELGDLLGRGGGRGLWVALAYYGVHLALLVVLTLALL